MLCGCIVTNLKSTFDSPVCEFTGKGVISIVSRCRCNVFTIGSMVTANPFCFSASYRSDNIQTINSNAHRPGEAKRVNGYA